MLKHASPQRSTSSLAQHLGTSTLVTRPSDVTRTTVVPEPAERCGVVALRDSYSERSVDCDSLIVPSSFAQAEKDVGYQVGTWSGVSQANVRRGLSFSSRRAPDTLSFRSVRSEGPTANSPNSSPSKMPTTSSSMINVSAIKDDVTDTPKGGMQCLKGDMSSLKNLLRLPGVRGQAKIIESGKSSALSPDSLSLNSSDSFFSANNSGRTSSRSWSSNASSNSNTTNSSTGSNNSASEPASTTIKVFAKCLRSDIEYKTISVSSRATCREVVSLLLSKYRMRHRDPNLFYLTMEVTVRRWSGAPLRSLLVLEENARPAQLALCRPPGDSRFALQMRRGGVIKVHDTVLMPGSQYKSLLVSDRTTSEEVVQLLLNCYNRRENKYFYALHEVRRSPDYNDRILLPDEKPLEVKSLWPRDRQAEYVFVLRRNMAQAMSLRRLSLRTSDNKRPSLPSEVATIDRPPVSSTASVSAVHPAAIPDLKPTQVKEATEAPFIIEDAVLDFTDVTPKMTTLSRMASSGSNPLGSPSSSSSSSTTSPSAANGLPFPNSSSSSSSSSPTVANGVPFPASSSSSASSSPPDTLVRKPPVPLSHPPLTHTSSLTYAAHPVTVHAPPTRIPHQVSEKSPPAAPTTSAPPPPPAASTTTDTATNTEAKSVSTTSTQTTVTRRFHRSSSVSREPERPPLHRFNSEPQLHAREDDDDETDETCNTPEKTPQLPAPSFHTPQRTPTSRRLCELLQHTPLQRCVTPAMRLSESLLSDPSSPTCFNQSHNITVLENADPTHKCKHNCEHCFYI